MLQQLEGGSESLAGPPVRVPGIGTGHNPVLACGKNNTANR